MNTNNILTKLVRHRENLTEIQHLQIVAILLILLFKACLYIGLNKVVVGFPYLVM